MSEVGPTSGQAPPTVPLGASLSKPTSIALGPGTLVGRYVVVEPLGSGGGGAVYAAYDAHLCRRVAIKVLATRAESTESTWSRVIAEAQLVARLDHPNVVTIHDVGVADDRAFIAMELVDGTDLDAWLTKRQASEPQPGWRELLEPLVLAGKGLAAAHERHVIHGDFKPGNVLVGKDGRVRVTDFGVARLRNPRPGIDHDRTHSTDGDPRQWLSTVTDNSTPRKLWGTPLYMAPELFDGQRPDEASDIYSYCASVYQALFGRAPAKGRSLMTLYAAKLEQPSAPRSAVPRRIRDVLLQGLDPESGRRPASVAAVLAVLETALNPRHRGYAWTASAIAISGAFAALGLHSWDQEASCSHAEEHLQGIWDNASKGSVRASMLATELPYADDTWARVERQLDNYTQTWVGLHTEACLATQRGEQSTELLDRKMMCLHQRRVQLDALVDVLQSADAKVVENALDASVSLQEVSDCQDFARLSTTIDGSPAAVAAREDVARARTLIFAGRFDDARNLLDDVRASATQSGNAEALVESLRWMGEIETREGHTDEAVRLLEEATMTAEVEKLDDVAARAGVALVQVLVTEKASPHKAEQWMPHIDIAVRRAAAVPDVAFSFFHARGSLHADLQRYDEALADLDRAEDTLADLPDPRGQRANLANAYGVLYASRGQWDLAERWHRQALALQREVHGEQHPSVAKSLDNLASVLHSRRQYDDALRLDVQALEIIEGAYGPDHPTAITIHANRAGVLADMGRGEEAAQAYREVIAAYERNFAEDHVHAAGARLNLAAVLGRMERYEEAVQVGMQGLEVVEANYGPEHPWVGYALVNVGTAQKHLGRPLDAVVSLERGLELLAKVLPDHAHELAVARVALAESLLASGGDRTRAFALAHAALEVFDEDSDDAKRAQAWLDHQR